MAKNTQSVNPEVIDTKPILQEFVFTSTNEKVFANTLEEALILIGNQ